MSRRALIACEYSGVVRNAFTRLGWDAVSCDLLPTDAPGGGTPSGRCSPAALAGLGHTNSLSSLHLPVLFRDALDGARTARPAAYRGRTQLCALLDGCSYQAYCHRESSRLYLQSNPQAGLHHPAVAVWSQRIQDYLLMAQKPSATPTNKRPAKTRQRTMGKPDTKRTEQPRSKQGPLEGAQQDLSGNRRRNGRSVEFVCK